MNNLYDTLIESGREKCYLAVEKIFSYELPEWSCRPVMIWNETVTAKAIPVFDFDPISLVLALAGLIAAGSVGLGLVTFCEKDIDYIIDPIMNKIEKRYESVVERNRLNSMNGHP